MGDTEESNNANPFFPIHPEFDEDAGPPLAERFVSSLAAVSSKDKRVSTVSLRLSTEDSHQTSNIQAQSSGPQKSEGVLNSSHFKNASHNSAAAAASSLSSDEAIVSTTRDTVVVLITLTIIFFTLILTYLLWKRRRGGGSSAHFSATHCKLEEYRYSRLSQNDVEVDNISFQGDLTHKTSLMNTVPVCVDEDADDDQVQPATLRLEYDSLVSISNDEKEKTNSQTSITTRDNNADLLIDEMSDEDLLQ